MSDEKKKKLLDVNETAARVMREATGQSVKTEPDQQPEQEPDAVEDDGKNPAAVALGRLGGKKGGPARAKKLTADERSEIARIAALARWRKAKGESDQTGATRP